MFICISPGLSRCRWLYFFSRTQTKMFNSNRKSYIMVVNGIHGFESKKTHSHNQIKPCCSWRYIKVVRHETIGLCKKPNSIYIIFYLWSTARSNCPERIHNIRGRDASTWHSRCMRGSDRLHVYVTHCLDRFHACFYYARAHWHVTHRMDVLRAVGHCGGSVVKK